MTSVEPATNTASRTTVKLTVPVPPAATVPTGQVTSAAPNTPPWVAATNVENAGTSSEIATWVASASPSFA